MSCIIYSRSQNTDCLDWKKINNFLDNDGSLKNPDTSNLGYDIFDKEYMINKLSETGNDHNNVTKQGYGYLCNIHNNVMIVTCNHSIGIDPTQITAYTTNKSNELINICSNFKFSVPEFDIAVLDVVNGSELLQYCYNLINIQTTDPDDINHTSATDPLDINYTSATKLNNRYVLKLLQISKLFSKKIDHVEQYVSDMSITQENIMSNIVPKIPVLSFSCDLSDQRINGLSGLFIEDSSLPKSEATPIGMIISHYNEKFQAIPMSIIKFIVLKYLNNKINICGFNIPTRNVKIELENPVSSINSTNTTFFGKLVAENCDTQYEQFESTKKTTSLFSFRQNDIIIGLDTKIFNEHGMIYCNLIDYYVNMDTYLMFNCISGRDFFSEFTIIREKNGQEKKLCPCLYGKQFDILYSADIFNSCVYLYWNKCIFVELSEEIIKQFSSLGIYLNGKIFKQLKKFTKNRKYVILVDINQHLKITNSNNLNIVKLLNKKKPTEISKQVFLENMTNPCVNTEIGTQLLVLDKVGNKQINNIADLKTAISKGNKQMTFLYEHDNAYNKLIIRDK